MWHQIFFWILGMAAICGCTSALLALQPVGKLTIVNRIAGIVLRPGIRPGRGRLIPMTVIAWLFWCIVGGSAIALISSSNDPSPGHHLRIIHVVYGLLCGIGFGIAGAGAGMLAGKLIVKITRMSSFEGQSGYFMVLVGLAGAVLGFLGGTIGMTVFFYRR